MSEIEKIQKYVNRTKVNENSSYCLRCLEWMQLVQQANESPAEAIVLAFNYGRAKGYRAAKAEAKA